MKHRLAKPCLLLTAALSLTLLAGCTPPAPTSAAPDPKIQLKFERLEAVQEIQNIMGRYSYMHTAGLHKESGDLFALKTPGVRAEMMWGVYEGEAGIRRLYPGFHEWADRDEGSGKPRPGTMHMHTLTTPVIEVAGDGKTAKAVWISPGHETGAFGGSKQLEAHWAWCKYAADFIKEDGQWKIWHLHVYGLFMSPYNQSWVEQPNDHPAPPLPDEFKPDRPPTTHWMYSTDRVPEYVPAPPQPYETFDEATAY